MLPIDQIIPFVFQDDPLVTRLAVRCLERIRWPEAITSEFLLEPVRQGRADLTKHLAKFVPTEAVLDYAIRSAREASTDAEAYWPYAVIEKAADSLLTDERLQTLRHVRFKSDWMTRDFNRRLDLMKWPTDRLRERLLVVSTQAEEQRLAGSEQHEATDIVRRLAERKDSLEWARQELQPRLGINKWTETWLFEVLIDSQDPQVLNWVLDRIAVVNPDENEALIGTLSLSLHQLCVAEDLPKLEAIWDRIGDKSKSYLIEGLAKFRIPEAEPILLRWGKEIGESGFEQTLAAAELCEMLATTDESREFIRDLIVRRAYDRSYAELETFAIPLGIILGRPFAEEPVWRQIVEETERYAAERRAIFEKTMGKKRYGQLLKNLQDNLHESREVSQPSEPVSPPVKLVTARTVGRNDPCPCGSGKKYKKCCLGKSL